MRRRTPLPIRVALLALATLALLATSVPREPCPPGSPFTSGPVRLEVRSTCGPDGTVVATAGAERCDLALEGASAVGLPPSGSVDPGTVRLGQGSRSCSGDETAPGVFSLRCYEVQGSEGCGGSNLPVCEGTLTVVP